MLQSLGHESTAENQMRVSLNFEGSGISSNANKNPDEFELKYDSSNTSK